MGGLDNPWSLKNIMNSLILTRSYIKNKPFEINQEFQEFEFEQKLNRIYKRWKYFSSWREVECLIIVWKKITAFFKRRVSIILWSFSS